MSRFLQLRARAVSRAVVTVLGVAVVAAACSGGGSGTASPTTVPPATVAPTTTTTSLPPGFVAFTDATDLFAVAVPGGWTQVNPSTATGQQQLQQLLNASGAAESALATTKFFAETPTAVNGYHANVAVTVEAVPGGSESLLPDIVSGFEQGTKGEGVTITSSSTGTMLGHAAWHANATISAVVKGRHIVEAAEFHLLIANNNLYSLTFTGTSPDFATIISTFTLLSPN